MIAVAPDAALVSARINWGVYYEYALNCLLTGEAIAQDWCGDYADGACYLSDLNTDVVADGTAEAIEAAAAGIIDGSVQVFAGPLHGVDADGNELNLAEGEFYTENETSSSPSFAYIIDGITVLS
jgi:basic membrane protein A